MRLKSQARQMTPQNDQDMEVMIAQIGQSQARIAGATAQADEAKALIDENLAQKTAEDKQFVKDATAAVTNYVEANRARLTPKGKKTITLKAGTIEYRDGRLSVTVRGADAVIAGLREQGFAQFITVKESVNKQAILDYARAHGVAELPNIAGLAIKQGEETLEIKPNESIEDVGHE